MTILRARSAATDEKSGMKNVATGISTMASAWRSKLLEAKTTLLTTLQRADAAATIQLENPACKRGAAMAAGLLCGAAAMLLITDPSWAAGTSGFDRLQATLSQWITGSLGKSLALGFLLIGLAGGLLRGSLSAAVVSLGCALALVVGPEIIDSVFTTGG